MSEQAVLDAVQLALGTVAGITVTRQGWPLAQPWTGGIGAAIYVDPAGRLTDRLTLSRSGIVVETYRVNLRLIVGNTDLLPSAAQAAGAPFGDRLRALVYADPTFGGACFDSTLTGGGMDNFTTFTRDQVAPALLWRLIVTEHRAANAAAP